MESGGVRHRECVQAAGSDGDAQDIVAHRPEEVEPDALEGDPSEVEGDDHIMQAVAHEHH